jgi:hypothetical protein
MTYIDPAISAWALARIRENPRLGAEITARLHRIPKSPEPPSETSGPDSCLLRTIEGTPTPAWQIVDTGDVLLTPSNDEIFKADGGSLADQSRAISEAELMAVAEKQRRYIEPYGPNKIDTSLVGGFLQVTTITESEIATRIVHRWPDEIGKRIELLENA